MCDTPWFLLTPPGYEVLDKTLSVVTQLRCGGKYEPYCKFTAESVSPTMKEFLKSTNIS